MDMSIQTSLSSMAWGRKFLSASVVALLLISVLAFAIPLAPVAHAEAVKATATVDKIAVTAGKSYGGVASAYGLIFTITNPASNTVPIKQVNVIIPSGWTPPTTSPTANVDVDPSVIGTVSISGSNVIVVTLASPYLQPGASFKVRYGLPASGISVPSKVASGAADVYTFEVYTMDTSSNTLVAVSEHPKVYVTSATTISVDDPASDKTVSADDKTYTVKFSLDVAESGVPLKVSLSDSSSPFNGNLSAATIWTDSNGKASVVLNLDTTAGRFTKVMAEAWITATGSPTQTTFAKSGKLTTVAGALAKLTITSPTATTYVSNGGTQTITIAATDQFGNAKTVSAATTVSLTIIEAVGGKVGTIPSTVTIAGGSSSTTATYDLTTYGTVGSSCKIYASAPGLAGATSPKLVTEVASTTNLAALTDPLPATIKVGKSDTVAVQLNIAQAGVRVNFTITWPDGTTTVQSATTNDQGIASTTITAPTKSGGTIAVTAMGYRAAGTPLATTFTTSAAVVAGDAVKLVVKTYETSALVTEKKAVKPSGILYVDVWLTDAYGNLAAASTDLQINLASSAGSLSQTTAYMATGTSMLSTTVISVPFFTAPSTVTDVTITASTPMAGISAASVVVNVRAPQPSVTITDPATDTTVVSNATVTKWIAGYATVSPAQPIGTTISQFKYSLNSAANVTVPIIYVSEGKYYFNFSVALAPDRINTITVYASDSQGAEASATRKITVSPAPARPVFPAEIKTPTLVDTAGRTVTAPRVGTIIAISSPIVNKQNTPQQTLYIVQVKDSTGAIVSFNFVSGTIPANTELTFAISWKPTEAGTYTIEVFAWNNFTEAQVLAPMQTITINVA